MAEVDEAIHCPDSNTRWHSLAACAVTMCWPNSAADERLAVDMIVVASAIDSLAHMDWRIRSCMSAYFACVECRMVVDASVKNVFVSMSVSNKK